MGLIRRPVSGLCSQTQNGLEGMELYVITALEGSRALRRRLPVVKDLEPVVSQR